MPPAEHPQSTPSHTSTPSGVGPLIGIVIVLLMLVVGAVYYWHELRTRHPNPPPYIVGDTATS